MSKGHWLAIGLLLTGFATQIQGLHTWTEMLTPAFLSGMLLNIGGVITAMVSPQIGRDPTSQDRRGDAKP